MASPNYKAVHLVVADADSDFSRPISSALFPRGLRDVTICKDGEALTEAVNTKLVDVLVCDVELPNTDFAETVYRLRHNELGQNPFIHIVATASVGAQDQIQRVIASGVDDLLRKPMSAMRVINRIDHLTRPRKPFVVAESYIGPNRRKLPRSGDDEDLMQVPNTLRAKVEENALKTEVRGLIDKTWYDITRKLNGRRPQAIHLLTQRIMAFYEGRGSEEELRRDLLHLVEKSDELIKRHRDSETSHIAELASSMAGVIRRIAETPANPHRVDMRLFPNLSDATRLSVSQPQQSVGTVREIAELVREFLDIPKVEDMPQA